MAGASAFYRCHGQAGGNMGFEPCAVMGTKGQQYPSSTAECRDLLAARQVVLVHVPRAHEIPKDNPNTVVVSAERAITTSHSAPF